MSLSWVSKGLLVALLLTSAGPLPPTLVPGEAVSLRQGHSAHPSPSLQEALGWLPGNTETILARTEPYRVQPPAEEPEEGQHDSVCGCLHRSCLEPLESLAKGACGKALQGRELVLSLEGARNFRPSEMGAFRYVGCHIFVFREALGQAADAFEKVLRGKARETLRIRGQQVFVIEKGFEEDRWTFYVTHPQANVLLCATDRAFLEEVLGRRARHAPIEAAPTRLEGWKEVVGTAPYWALRRPARRRESDVSRGLVFALTPGHRDAVRIRVYHSFASRDEMQKCWAEMAHATPRTRTIQPGVIETTFTVKTDGKAPEKFLFTFAFLIGHGMVI